MIGQRLKIPLICIVAWIAGAMLWNVVGVVALALLGSVFMSPRAVQISKS